MTKRQLRNILMLVTAVLAPTAFGFVPRAPTRSLLVSTSISPMVRQAKKSKNTKGGKGFAKVPPASSIEPNKKSDDTSSSSPSAISSDSSQEMPKPSFLQSVESGGSSSIPTIEKVTRQEPELPPQERAKQVLREKYGLRTLEEQRMEDKLQEQKQRLEELKQLADKGDDFDVMAVLPAPLLKGIDTFLKLGVAICTILFVTAGLGITAEAWSKTSGNPLPDDIDNFIVNVVEPNFTAGLLVLLGFSISLGGFAALQLGSASSQYKEE